MRKSKAVLIASSDMLLGLGPLLEALRREELHLTAKVLVSHGALRERARYCTYPALMVKTGIYLG